MLRIFFEAVFRRESEAAFAGVTELVPAVKELSRECRESLWEGCQWSACVSVPRLSAAEHRACSPAFACIRSMVVAGTNRDSAFSRHPGVGGDRASGAGWRARWIPAPRLREGGLFAGMTNSQRKSLGTTIERMHPPHPGTAAMSHYGVGLFRLPTAKRTSPSVA